MLDRVAFVVVEGKRGAHEPVVLDEFRRRETQGNRGALGVIVDQLGYGVDAAMQRAAVFAVGAAEVLAAGPLFVAGYVEGMVDELVDALSFRC